MAIKIPQNIDKEDKLVGPLTLKQFLYVLGGAAIVFVAYQYYARAYLYFFEFMLIATLAVFLTLALAFLKINGQPFILFMINALLYILSPKKRLWHRDNQIIASAKKLKLGQPQISQLRPADTKIDKSQLEQLANILDTGGKMDTEMLANEHTINTLEFKKVKPETIENELAIEDILAETE